MGFPCFVSNLIVALCAVAIVVGGGSSDVYLVSVPLTVVHKLYYC